MRSAFLCTLVYVVTVGVTSTALACVIPGPPSTEFEKYNAPAGGVFFIQVSSDPAGRTYTEHAEENGALVDAEGERFPIQVVSAAGRSLAIRVPSVPPGTVFDVEGMGIREQLVTTRFIGQVTSQAPVLDGVHVEVSDGSYRTGVVGLPDFSCGQARAPAAISRNNTAYVVDVLFPGQTETGDVLVVDAWTRQSGRPLDVQEQIPFFAGSVPTVDHPGIFPDGDETVIRFGPWEDATNFDLHVRVRDSITGLASNIVVVPISVPAPAAVEFTCTSTTTENSGVPLVALSLSSLVALRLRRQQRLRRKPPV